ncbi:MAG: bifunctional 4-hydroxy-3-methylbut-2-enyl diphosphate reductase/30S ribosomal protein S1, partial [Sporomusa sp.]
MKIYLAQHHGFCYGVKRAIDMALSSADINEQVYTLGPIIHNPQMVTRLNSLGIAAAANLEEIPAAGRVIIRSHGVGPEIYRQADAKHLAVVDATSPHVKKAQ